MLQHVVPVFALLAADLAERRNAERKLLLNPGSFFLRVYPLPARRAPLVTEITVARLLVLEIPRKRELAGQQCSFDKPFVDAVTEIRRYFLLPAAEGLAVLELAASE